VGIERQIFGSFVVKLSKTVKAGTAHFLTIVCKAHKVATQLRLLRFASHPPRFEFFMKIVHPLRLLCLAYSLTSVHAQATSFVMSTDLTVSLTISTSKGTSSSFKDDKIVLAAKDDAAAFVASHGDIRGARMEAAFRRIREVLKDPSVSDLQLANSILAL
jgi:uncharacterized protein (TIGR02448 family)